LIISPSFRCLRSPCNILIAACALFDVVHQAFLTLIVFNLVGRCLKSKSETFSSVQFLPEMGVAGGNFAILSIGMDRFLSIAVPNKYRTMDVATYLSMQFVAIFVYCAFIVFLMVFFFRDE
ncbi:hypothetical protein PFISCL1PPCAC_13139, partial [Pristionchus fissidentatus]